MQNESGDSRFFILKNDQHVKTQLFAHLKKFLGAVSALRSAGPDPLGSLFASYKITLYKMNLQWQILQNVVKLTSEERIPDPSNRTFHSQKNSTGNGKSAEFFS